MRVCMRVCVCVRVHVRACVCVWGGGEGRGREGHLRGASPVQHLIRVPPQQSLLISPSPSFIGITILDAAIGGM